MPQPILTAEQIVQIGQWLIFGAVVIMFFVIQYQKDKHVLNAWTQALRDVQSNPVALENARAAGANIPQQAYDNLYHVVDGVVGLIGGQTEAGQALSEAEKLAKRIDHDPSNDPLDTPIVPRPPLPPDPQFIQGVVG